MTNGLESEVPFKVVCLRLSSVTITMWAGPREGLRLASFSVGGTVQKVECPPSTPVFYLIWTFAPSQWGGGRWTELCMGECQGSGLRWPRCFPSCGALAVGGWAVLPAVWLTASPSLCKPDPIRTVLRLWPSLRWTHRKRQELLCLEQPITHWPAPGSEARASLTLGEQ